MRSFAPLLLLLFAGAALSGAELEIDVAIPRLEVAEYHRPYVALWVEKPDGSFAANLAVWYDLQTSKAEHGTTWLKDLRQWWRKSGRSLKMPVDGVSGATRPPGSHTLRVHASDASLASLQPGSYKLAIEASREVGGRELLQIPFEWPPRGAQTASADGEHELGKVEVRIKP